MDYTDGEMIARDSRSATPPRHRDERRSATPERRRSPVRGGRTPPPVPRPRHAPSDPEPTNVVGVFGLSVRTTEQDIEEKFGQVAAVDKVVIVYDARSSRSRGFGFVTMKTVDDAGAVIKELNGIELHGRRLRVDYSVTTRPHDPTPGEYRGEPRRDDFAMRGPPGPYGGMPPRGWGPPPPWFDGPPGRPPFGGGGGGGGFYGGPPRGGGGGFYGGRPPPGMWGPPGGGRPPMRGGAGGGGSYRGGSGRNFDDRRGGGGGGGGPDGDDDWRRNPRDRERSHSPAPRRRGKSDSRSPPPRRVRDDDRGGDRDRDRNDRGDRDRDRDRDRSDRGRTPPRQRSGWD